MGTGDPNFSPSTQGLGSNVLDFYRNRFSDIYNQYTGQVGGQAAGGQSPTLQFQDYLQSYPFLQEFYGQAPAARGELNKQFAPPTQFMQSY